MRSLDILTASSQFPHNAEARPEGFPQQLTELILKISIDRKENENQARQQGEICAASNGLNVT
jgi:hypothetical protein